MRFVIKNNVIHIEMWIEPVIYNNSAILNTVHETGTKGGYKYYTDANLERVINGPISEKGGC